MKLFKILLLTGLIFNAPLFAEKIGNLEFGGAFFGVANSLNQKDAPVSFASRDQFDFAANLDVGWQMHRKIRGVIQLQMGSGGGSLGFGESSATLTDINLTFLLHRNFNLIFGSFDTPFGLDTPYLTNNGNPSANALILNSLFYAAFAGTHVGTLNTLGLMGNYASDYGQLTLALTNGAEESAVNSDGGFEFVGSLATPDLFRMLTLGGSVILSDDSSASGVSGTRTNFSGFLGDAHFHAGNNFFLRGYFGRLIYDDDRAQTQDEVTIWKIEAIQKIKKMTLAARISGWAPEDDNGGMDGFPAALPMAGLAQSGAGLSVPRDQSVSRFQFACSREIDENIFLRGEIFFDDYAKSFENKSADVLGVLFGFNMLFQ